jgi:S-adenosylhomocysteine hydrolase
MAINQSNFKDKMNEWMTIEDKIEKLNKDIKKLRDEKTSKEQKLIEYMKSSNLSNKVIKLNNQKVNIGNDNTYTTLSYKYIEETLKKKYNNTTVKEIIEYLKNERDKKTSLILKKSKLK